MHGCVSEEVEPVRDVPVDRLFVALVAVVFETDSGVIQSNHGTAMAGQVPALSSHTIATVSNNFAKSLLGVAT